MIPNHIVRIVAEYATNIKYKLLDWIPNNKIAWKWLSKNPAAIHLLKANFYKIS